VAVKPVRLAALAGSAVLAGSAMVLGLAAAGLPAAAAIPAAVGPGDGPVVLIGTGGVTWQDAGSDTPTLRTYLDLGSTGQLAVRSVRESTCPVDGWLAVSAGRRAADEPVTVPKNRPAWCRAPAATFGADGEAATVTRWPVYLEAANGESFDARPGTLGESLRRAGLSSAAVGPGAVTALALPDGRAPHAWNGLGDGYATLTLTPQHGDLPGFTEDLEAALATHPDVLVIDVGGIRDVRDDLLAGGGTGGTGGTGNGTGGEVASRDVQAGLLDDRLATVTGALPGGATVFVASTFDSGDEAALRVAAAAGDDYVSSLLGSRSTRQDGMVQTTDLLPTVLSVAGAAVPAGAVGSRIVAVQPGGSSLERYEKLLDLDQAATAMHDVVPIFFLGLLAAQLVLYLLATVLLRRDVGGTASRTRMLTTLQVLAVIFACVPAATFVANLAPWWRADSPGAAVSLLVLGIAVAFAAVALLGPWRRRLLGPMGAVGAITALVLAADVLTGSHLMLSSLMGVQPVVGGRFYGFSNPGFALFATGALLAAVAVADRLVARGQPRHAAAAVAVIGLVALVVDGAPPLGADFGGPPAIIPAFAVLAMLVSGTRVTWRRAVLIAAIAVVVVLGIAVLDWLRPLEDQTHLGRFVQTVLDGGLWSVIGRKLAQNAQILLRPVTALLPFAVGFVVLVLARPVRWGVRPLQEAYDRAPVLRSGLIAFGVLVGIGFLMNDSGTVIPGVAATVALPLLIAVGATALQRVDQERGAPVRRPRLTGRSVRE
jgi:hypothetical protein